MTKSEGDMRGRLQQAALALFRDRGYDSTTATEIAARAGVTERTFFRYFRDKREVLFGGETILREALTTSIHDAPDDLGPLEILFRAFRSVRELLEDNRPFSVPRQEVISATPALHERELAKTAALADALARALKARGVADAQATLAAHVGMTAFVYATIAWIANTDGGLAARLDHVERELKAMV